MPETAPSTLAGLLPAWLEDVAVELAPVSPVLSDEQASGVLWSAAPGRFLLDVPGVARYLTSNGCSLVIDAQPGATESAVAAFAATTPLAALCYQRGMAVLHAAVAVRDGGAVALAGGSATGKSTLLAGLLARGWSMLGDDLAPLQYTVAGGPIVWPTSTQVGLWPDATEQLERDPGFNLRPPAPSGDAPIPGAARFQALPAIGSPVRLRSIWALSIHNEPGVTIEDVEGLDRFDTLGGLVYNGRVAHALLDRVAYMRIAAAVAESVTLRRVLRPRGSWSLEELTEAIDADR